LKVPVAPPDAVPIFEKLAREGRLTELLGQTFPGALSREYLPWDKLRHRKPPLGLAPEEWWAATRIARRSLERPIELLRAVGGKPFTYALPDALLAAIDEVTRSASGNIAISEQVTSPATRYRYVVSSLIEEAITSSQLEGASTTRRVAKDMIRTGRPPRDRSEQMIYNNYLAMQRIVELQHERMTPDLVCEIHRIVTEGTLDNPNAAGVIQSDEGERVSVWDGDQLLHRPPPVGELQDRLERLCEFANGAPDGAYIPPVLRAIAVHFMVGYDHYFEDGNGRTARALFYWSMLKQGYWLTEFLTISRTLKRAPAQYARSFLLTEQDDGDLTHFFLYQINVILRAIRDLREYLMKKADELREVQRSMKALPGEYNHRQLALLQHAIRTPDAVFTAESHARSHNVSTETARQDLMALEEKGLVYRFKIGKRFAWTPLSDLSTRLTT
jgi:Fic family protein